ncbi:MAG TPA: pyridoxamine 5'-phosphate oxidase family protein [Burkholderiaceae bacterium]|nr:pyridoxamine 5'-phosphate oxidase family protein [Burkholderiaceae bacterium]
MSIESIEQLRNLYAAPKERAIRKQLTHLDVYCRRFISLSPFLVLASSDADGRTDASPRGGDPGFVKVPNDSTLLIPDAPGNNRLDSLENIVTTSQVGLLFVIPGVDETLRANGIAILSDAERDNDLCANERRRPKLVIRVSVREAYLHCAKALMRARLWSTDSRIDRARLPTLGQMINDQTGIDAPVETQEEMVRRYRRDL